MEQVEDIHSFGTYPFFDNLFHIIDYSSPPETDKKTKDCKRYDAKRTKIGYRINHVLISNNCCPVFMHSSGNTNYGYQLDSCGVDTFDDNIHKLDIIDDTILDHSNFMVKNGHVVFAFLRYLQTSIDISYYSMKGEKKFRCFDWGRMMEDYYSQINTYRFHLMKKRNVYNLLNMSYTSNYDSLKLLIMGPAWLHEMDDVSLYPISWVELKKGDPISVSQSAQQDTCISSLLHWGRMYLRFLPLSGVTSDIWFTLLGYIISANGHISMYLFNQSSCRYMWML
jgi:hypothetical protein